jgi:uncharacterized repeat protein (TIGR01451 family)
VKQFFKILAVLGLGGFAVLTLAQNTAGGTQISNTATATFTDSGGVTRNSTSNTVLTTVQTVYSFNIEPDDNRDPAASPTFVNPTANSTNVAAGATTTFNYTVINNTNNGTGDTLPVTLTAVQDSGDDFNLNNVIMTVYNFTDVSGDGLYTAGTDTLGSAVVTGTANNPVTFNFPALSQGTRYAVVVTGQVPGTQTGNQAARLDLRATNNDAPVDNTATGANVYYENQNVARIEVNEIVRIGAAKTVTSTVNNGNGTYDVTYTINVENFSNVALSNVQVTDNLTTTFTGASSWTLISTSTTGGLTRNTGYTGTTAGSINLLAAANTLAIGGTGSITVVVRVTPGSGLGPYNNQATASGTSPDGTTDTDLSDSGTDPDPDGDNDPDEPGEGDTTPLTFTEDRGLGVAKSASTPTAVSGSPGLFETTLTFTLRNLSDASNGTELRNVQITDNLAATFPSPATFTVQSRSATGVTVNSSFNGNSDPNLLAANQTLARNTSATVTIVVRFDPNGSTTFSNRATATGTTPQGTTLTDLSDNGTNPDQDGDGWGNEQSTAYDLDRDGTIEDLVLGAPNPDEGMIADPNSNGSNNTTSDENDPTPITVSDTGVIGVAKRVTSITALTGANLGRFDVTFEINLENFGNVNLSSVQVVDAVQTRIGATATLISVTAPVVSNVSSGSSLTANGSYNGNGNNNLLTTSSANLLRPGGTGRITFTARIDPNGVANLSNVAVASGTTPGGTTVNDDSTDGADPDGTDNDNTPDENTPTPIDIPESPQIGITKQLGTVTNNNNGTYTLTYTLNVQNLGNVDLTTVRVTDTLPFTSFTVTALSATATGAGASLTANALSGAGSYTGLAGGNNLLTAGTLPVGTSGTITLTMQVTPGTNLGPYNNSATASALSPEGASTDDISNNGTDVDGADNVPDNADDQAVTPVTFTESPAIGLAKAATVAADAAGFPGQFTTTLTFVVQNLGDVPLNNAQISDNLNTTFGSPATYTVTSVSGTGANSSFNGNTDQNLLAANQSLTVSGAPASRTVTVVVRFNPNGVASPFNNTATATATSPGSATAGNVTDISDNGSDPRGTGGDGDNNAGETGENDQTPITFTERPSVGVAKTATLLDANTDGNNTTAGPYDVRFDIRLENLGNVALTNLQITENLVSRFTSTSNFSIQAAPSIFTAPSNGASTINLNSSFNGNTDISLLAANSTLAVGDFAVIRLTVRLNTAGAYTNQVTATGNGPAGRGSDSDTSDDGTDPDTNNDGDGDDTGEDTPTPVNLDAVQLEKSARVCSTETCTSGVSSTVTDATGALVSPGQYIEYTIVARNLGGVAVTNIVINDPIPTPSRFMTSTTNTPGITCSTSGVGGPYSTCPTTTATGSTTVTHVRFASFGLAANDNATGGSDESTVRFVVYVP